MNLVRFIGADLTYYSTETMKNLRNTSLLTIASLLLLALFTSSFAACLVTANIDCCEDDHECDDPLCGDGAICHCSCAYTCILPETPVITPIPILAGKLSANLNSVVVSHVSLDLFRPPRLS